MEDMEHSNWSILDLLRIRSTVYLNKQSSGIWSTAVTEHPHLTRFHIVLAGTAWVTLPDGTEALLKKGEYVIIPNGVAHCLSSDQGITPFGTDIIPQDDLKPLLKLEMSDANATHLLCGFFQLSDDLPHVVISRLPSILVQRASDDRNSLNTSLLLQLIKDELKNVQNQPSEILNRLSEILCLHAIKQWLKASQHKSNELSTLFNPKFQNLLNQIHNTPQFQWSVESLANVVGQSRSAFALHFKSTMGTAPMEYVTRHRIQFAKRMLEQTGLPLNEIAFRVGYKDISAFTRAFKRVTGISPGVFRKERT